MRGYGEAGENPYYGATIDEHDGGAGAASGRRSRPPAWTTRPTLWEALRTGDWAERRSPSAPWTSAAHDLWGKLRGQPVWKLWGLRIDRLPPTDYTIGIDTIEVMVAQDAGVPRLADLQDQARHGRRPGDRPRAARAHRRPSSASTPTARWDAERDDPQRRGRCKELGVEFIEQPLPPDDWDEMRRVLRRVGPADDRRRKLPRRGRRGPLPRATSTASTSSWSSAAA